MIFSKRFIFILLLFCGPMNKSTVSHAHSIQAEQISAALTIPLSCLQTYLEDKNPLLETRTKGVITVLSSLTRIINTYYQHANNCGDLYDNGNSIYLGWMIYDAIQLLEAFSTIISPKDNEVLKFINDLEDEAKKNSEDSLQKNKIIRQVLLLAEGGTTLLASLHSGAKYSKNTRGICYALSSCLRLGTKLLSQNPSTPKKTVGIALVLNCILLIKNVIEDQDGYDRLMDQEREAAREREHREDARRREQYRQRAERERARRMAEEAEQRRWEEQWRQEQEEARREYYEEQQRRAREEATREHHEAERRLADAYSFLGLPSTASDNEIARTYRKRAAQLHPDRNPGPDAHRQMQDLINARDLINTRRGFN